MGVFLAGCASFPTIFFLLPPFSSQCTLSGLIAHSISTTSLPDRYINYHPHTKPIPGRHCGRVVVDPLFYFLHPFRPRKQQNSNWLCSNRMQQDKSVLFFFCLACALFSLSQPCCIVIESKRENCIKVRTCSNRKKGHPDAHCHTRCLVMQINYLERGTQRRQHPSPDFGTTGKHRFRFGPSRHSVDDALDHHPSGPV